MTASDGITHLRTLGLSDPQIAVYQSMLETGATTVDGLVLELHEPEATVHRSVQELVRTGLVALLSESDTEFRPIFPGPALERLAARRAAELDYAHNAVLDTVEAVRRSDLDTELDSVVEVVAGDDVEAQLSHAESQAVTEVRSLDCPPYYAEAVRNAVEPANLRRGVNYRVVYAATALDRPHVLNESIAPLIRDGELAHTIASVATKLMIIDDQVAFVAATTVPDSTAPVLLVRPSGLFNGLVGLFEYTWRASSELDTTGRARSSPLNGSDRRMLTMLASGATDEQIARSIGVSRRTFFRRLERLMKVSGAMTRFELAVRANRLNWF